MPDERAPKIANPKITRIQGSPFSLEMTPELSAAFEAISQLPPGSLDINTKQGDRPPEVQLIIDHLEAALLSEMGQRIRRNWGRSIHPTSGSEINELAQATDRKETT